jgi:phosphate transport system substrate-binding protein
MLGLLTCRTVVAVAVLASGCGAAMPVAAEESFEGVVLRGGGSSFAAPLFKGWIEAFAKVEPGLSIEYDSIGSGEGMSRFVTGSLDFAGTDAPLPSEQAAMAEGKVLQLPLAAGLVVICYNLPGVTGELRLPREVYTGIFDGTITSWDDPRIGAANPDLQLPQRTIAMVVRRDGSGTTFAFTNHLNAIDLSWRERKLGAALRVDWPASAMTARGNEGVAATILQAEYSIGYVEYGFAQRLGLPMAVLENRDGQFVAPAVPAGEAALAPEMAAQRTDLVRFVSDPAGAGSYPIVTLTWALVHKAYSDPRKADALKAFLGWGLVEGQPVAKGLEYVTLPTALAGAAQAALDQVH